jgi:membrane protease YdiL (CAAX protease family)
MDAVRTDQPVFPNAIFGLVLTVCVVALQMAFAVPLEVAAAIYAGITHQPPSHPAQHPFVLGLINVAAFGSVVGGAIYFAKLPLRAIFAFQRVRGALWLPILLSMAGAVVVLSEADNVFRWIFPVPKFVADIFRNLFSPDESWWGALFVLVVVAPLTEEVLFRGLILRGLLSRHGARLAIVLSAALFALMHMNPWQMISASLFGVLFGWWYHRTRSIVPGLIGHALANGAVLTVGSLPVEIAGFNKGEPYGQTEFQPLWLNATGLVLLALGIWLFHRWSPKPAYDGPPPPVIPPRICEPSI